MGNRVKGRVKKKAIKAASHSAMGSKRKLSRMGKRQKKDHAGLDATFIGRSACLKRLQISLKDFRRLCILKGVYPREPRGRTPSKKKGQVYYHIKDLRAIAHEPLLAKFREFRGFMKKVRKAAGRNEKDEAVRKESYAPSYTLHHLVRERYPRFVDALSDVDDALALVYLFAALPSTGRVAAKITKKAQSLAAQWGAYCATTSCVTKSFVSVKGVYMEASIQGCDVCWVVPHAFTQNIPTDVDFRVMTTFFEFYETLLGFVLFKLYNDIGVRYPLPVTGFDISSSSSVLAANLHILKKVLQVGDSAASNAVTEAVEKQSSKDTKADEKDNESKSKRKLLNTVDEALKKVKDDDDDENEEDDEDDVDIAGPLKAALESMNQEEENTVGLGNSVTLDDEASKRKRLFAGLTFFLSREVPRGYLELTCLAFGGKVGWEGADSPISAKDPSITHHVVDRPKLPSSYDSLPKSREFVQPQWILDCANFRFLLPLGKYGVGTELPPHLSPWVDNEEEGYTPAYAEEIECLKNGQPVPEQMDVEEEKEPVDLEEDMAASDEDDTSVKEKESSDDDEEEDEEEFEKKDKEKKNKTDDDAKELAKNMMSKKAARLYGRMQHGISKKEKVVAELHRRRQKIQVDKNNKGRTVDGKSILKAKVERLKGERRSIEKDYEKTAATGSMKKKKRRKTKK
jgi:pescadillo protein